MALLPADPRQRKQALALMAVVIGGLWYVGKVYLIDPRGAEVEEVRQNVERLETKNRRSKVLAAQRDDIKARMESMEGQLDVFERLIPASEEVPELLDAISQEARFTDVELALIRPRETEATEYYTKRTWELSVQGDYHDVGRYLTRIASLPRIIRPTGVRISPGPVNQATRDMEAPLEVAFTIETFVLGGAPSDTTGTAQGAASGD